MSMQMNLDEMLQCVSEFDPAGAEKFQALLETVGTQMAESIATQFDCVAGPCTFEGVAFAGTCAPFNPRFRGQPFPSDEWDYYDDGGREAWEEAAKDETLPPMPVTMAQPEAMEAARALAVEVSAWRTVDDGVIITCNETPQLASGFGVYIRNPLALHVQDFFPCNASDPGPAGAMSQAFAFADVLAAHLGCSVVSPLSRECEPGTPLRRKQDGPYSPELAEAFRIGARELCNSALGDRIDIDENAAVTEVAGGGGALVHCALYVTDDERAALGEEED